MRRLPLLPSAAAGAAATGAWAVWIEPRRLVVRRVEVEVEGWPAPLDGLGIACVADLHAGAPQMDAARVARVVERTNALGADLIALLGDFVDPAVSLGTRVAPAAVADELRGLRAPLGVLAVLGNHDWASEGERVPRALRWAGLTVLENESVALEHRGVRFWVAGLADPSTREPDVSAALEGIPPADPVIALSHDPDLFPHLPDRIALTLSGHTHGGQVNLPGLRALVTPSRYGFRYARGVKRAGRRTLFTTSGVGTSRWPIRLGRPPEIALVTLRGSRPAAP